MTREPRPPMTRLTALTLHKAYSQAGRLRRMDRPVPEGLQLLARDYANWRKRVRRGTQRETLMVVRDGS